FALDGETKVAGFDDPGVDRTDGHLEEALAFDAAEGKRLSRVGEVPTDRHVAAVGKITIGPELVDGQAPQVRVADRHEAEEIVDLALEAAGREGTQRERRKSRLVGGDRHPRPELPGTPWRRENGRPQ